MTIVLCMLLAAVSAAIVVTSRRRGLLRVLRFVVLYPFLLLLCFVVFARWQLRSAVPHDVATIKHGKQLFESTCQGCHSLGQGRRIGPDLRYVGDRYDGAVLSLWMMNSDAVYQDYGRRPLTQSYPPMPKLGIAKQDADAISAYLMSISEDNGEEGNGEESNAGEGTQPTRGD